ncbi:DNA binding protein, putative [Ricinus communis]|uniref:DNA binding protein, putative n=1 Tax=Ricinus communis TaxID=3988 RepID=B9RIY1_RICCO|nr:DNA binding protein, putative [Ricinus communis]|eukprot:XP_025012156.1 AT-rich interactive domain-containing protein 2-like [Ricinus communis]
MFYKADDQEGSFGKSQEHESSGNNCVSEASKLVKDFRIAVPWSLVTSNSVDDDVGSRFTAYSSDFLEHEFDVPRRLEASDDAYFSYLDSSPRKQVPLGPNHQASIPLFGKRVNKNQLEWEDTLDPGSSSLSKSDLDIHTDNEEKFLGTCIIPMPDTETSADNSDEIGGGRKDCSCMDEGSVRCVRQHIMEARESLLKFLRHEQLVHLGFYEMGEEVTHKWTKEKERVFHAVVNSNPASLGQNF